MPEASITIGQQRRTQAADAYNAPDARLYGVLQTARTQPRRNSFGSRKETLDDLERDSVFQQDAEVFLSHLGTRDDIFETLRDSDYNIAGGIHRAATAGDWPEDVKQAYARLRTRFDNADTGSFNQYLEAAKDIGIDIVSDPTVLAAVVLSPFTGGASLAARQTAVQAARVGVKRLTATAVGAAEGVVWAGADSFTRQKIAEEVGLQDGVESTQVLASAAIGGVLGGLVGKLIDSRSVARAARVLDETNIDVRIEQEAVSSGLFGVRPLAKAVSATVGKPSTVLDPLTGISPTASRIQRAFRSDQGRELSTPFNRVARTVAQRDYNQIYMESAGKHWSEIQKIIEPISFNRSGKLDKDVNSALVTALRKGYSSDPTINEAANKVRVVLDDIFEEMTDVGLLTEEVVVKQPAKMFKKDGETLTESAKEWIHIALENGFDPFKDKEITLNKKVNNYFKRKWNRGAIERNPQELKKLLIKDGEAADMEEANKIVEELLDKENQLSSPAAEIFNVSRKFTKIKDDSKYEEFLDNDFKEVMLDYITQTQRKAAAVKAFGVKSQQEFNNKIVEKIVEEAGVNGKVLSRKERQDIANLYKFATGEGVHQVEGTLGVLKDWTALAYQVSMLPLATLSSLTEVVIPLTRVDSPTYFKGLVQGMGAGFKKISVDLVNKLGIKHNMSKPEVFKELERFMIALDQTTADHIERLSGQNIRSSVARKAQNAFFKLNLLTPWTQTVQATSFIIGKDLITNNLKKLSKMSNLETDAGFRLRNELSDLGIDYRRGLDWVKRGAKKDDDYYLKVQEGASVFTNEVILPTSREAGTKPHIMSNPQTDIFFQFLSYPAAFNNIVLKNMATQVIENPIRSTAKIAVGGIIMTAMARFGNFVRTEGESEKDVSEWEANFNGLVRWGGNGLMLDMMRRSREGIEATGTVVGGIIGFTGPLPGEVLQSMAYRRGPSQILGSKVPGYGAGRAILGEEVMDDYNTMLREGDKKLMNFFKNGFKQSSGSF